MAQGSNDLSTLPLKRKLYMRKFVVIISAIFHIVGQSTCEKAIFTCLATVKVRPVKVSYLTSVAKQAKNAFLHGPTVCKSPIVGIEPATFRSESAALTTAPRDTDVNFTGMVP